jgi:hypothetical protein
MQNKKKKMRNQNTIYTQGSKEIKQKKIILTDLLSTSMAIEGNGVTKTPKIRILRKIIVEEKEKYRYQATRASQEMKWQTYVRRESSTRRCNTLI